MRTMRFNNGQEMLETLGEGFDLYNEEKELYVFIYNDDGSICAYEIDKAEAEDLREKQREHDEYWSAFLGVGGSIYDSVTYDDFNPDEQMSNIDFCNEVYSGDWEDVTYAD